MTILLKHEISDANFLWNIRIFLQKKWHTLGNMEKTAVESQDRGKSMTSYSRFGMPETLSERGNDLSYMPSGEQDFT